MLPFDKWRNRKGGGLGKGVALAEDFGARCVLGRSRTSDAGGPRQVRCVCRQLSLWQSNSEPKRTVAAKPKRGENVRKFKTSIAKPYTFSGKAGVSNIDEEILNFQSTIQVT